MKKILYILTAFAFGLAACTQELDTQNTLPEDCIMLKVFNSPMTKAVNAAGEEYERQLNRLDCFFYIKDQTESDCVYYQKVDLDEQGQAEIPFYVDETIITTIFPSGTTCDVFVIANLPEGTFATGDAGTDVNTLSKILLDLEDEDHDYDAIVKPFVMAGLGEATKGENNNATGTIPLYRAAAKVTISVNVPAEIKGTVKVESEGTITEQEAIFTPILTNDQGEPTMMTSFHNGVTKTYLNTAYVDADGNSLTVAEDLFSTAEFGYTFVSTTPETDTAPAKHLYTCEVPFYTYARAWEKGASDAAYLTLQMPWTNDITKSYQTYYYQILVNAQGRSFEPNHWYDLTVNVGVLGSTVEQEPKLLEDLTYYVLDWTTEPESETGDRYENVDIQNYTYLIVYDQRLEINNATTGLINYDASHKIGWMMDTSSKTDEVLYKTTEKAAFYINCGATSGPTLTDLSISTGNFTDDGKGGLTYNYEIPSTVYSPVYVYITIWLDINGDGTMDEDEAEFTEKVTIVQYPAIYIIPDQSTSTSVYVNGHRDYDSNVTFNEGNTEIKLGKVTGTSSDGDYMYVITVSSFAADDNLVLNGVDYGDYIIGDPRQTTIDNNMSTTYTFTDNWVTAPSVYQGEDRTLKYYYPTSTDPDAFRVIAPKFRVVSFLSTVGGSTNVSQAGAPLRCASYQEDGFPAGRWRVPTAAEIYYVANLQANGAIVPIFVSGSKYFSSTGMVSVIKNEDDTYTTAYSDFDTSGTIRCVYDEWYWGSERDAKVNSAATEAGEYYLFTWGDEPR